MKKTSILELDLLKKEELISIKGGVSNTNKVCGCICIGPVVIVGVDGDPEISGSDEDCTDSNAANTHNANNQSPTL